LPSYFSTTILYAFVPCVLHVPPIPVYRAELSKLRTACDFQNHAIIFSEINIYTRPLDRLFWLRSFVVFLSSPKKCCDSAFKVGHDHYPPHHFQVIIHLSRLSFDVMYSESLKKASLKISNNMCTFTVRNHAW
jgi:hypothetical protein